MDTAPAAIQNLTGHLQGICLNNNGPSERSTPSTNSHTPAATPSRLITANTAAQSTQQSAFLFPPALPARSLASSQINDEHYHLYHEPFDLEDDNNNQDNNNNEAPGQLQKQIITADTFADAGTSSHDVSDDIYFCYITQKSTKRTINNRSRSYHGFKHDPQASSSTNTSPFIRDAPKNLSTSSVAELPISATSNFLPIKLRDHCVRELIETESNYVHALDMIIRCFAKPLESYLKRDEFQLIFGHIKYFHGIHSSFQAELMKSTFNSFKTRTSSNPSTPTSIGNIPAHFMTNSINQTPQLSPSFGITSNRAKSQILTDNNVTLSSCFVNFKERFLRYGEYCTTLSKAQLLLDELSNKNDAVASQLTRCQQDANEGRFKLRDLLSLPMQRILKYHLLLAQLIKNTGNSHEDYYGLKRAHEAMVDLCQYINEVKRDNETIQIINEIENSITDLDMPANTHLIDYGRLVADGYIKAKLPDETKAKRYVFVFDKVIIMCKKVRGVRGEQYCYKEALVLDEFEIDVSSPLSTNSSNFKHDAKEKWTHSFKLVRSNDRISYLFYAKTSELRDKWTRAIKSALDNIRPPACRTGRASSHDLVMHTFEKATSCDFCARLLHGLFYQGYKCRVCHMSLHRRCLDRQMRLCAQTLPPRLHSNIFRPKVTKPPSPSVVSNSSDGGSSNCSFFPDVRGGYVNFMVNEYPWFLGRMDRDKAQEILEDKPSETFLVRVSPKQKGSYVISLNYNSQVKHMRIYVTDDSQLYLSENRYFNSLVELVTWYENNNLAESFNMLNARLGKPVDKLNFCSSLMGLPMKIETSAVQ